jgi:hypothetical protein
MYLNQVLQYINSTELSNSKNKSIEFEIKILLDPRINSPQFVNKKSLPDSIEIIKSVLNNASKYGSSDISQTINFINTEEKHMFVKQLVFENGVQNKDKKCFYIKKPLIDPIYLTSDKFPSYKLCMNEEIIQDTDINKFDIVRFRLRYSITFDNTISTAGTANNLDGWRLDLTFVKETKNQSVSHLKNIRDRLFTDNLAWDYADKIEMEMEYIGDLSKLTIEHISNLDSLWDVINTKKLTYEGCIYQIAKIIKPNILHKFKSGYFGLKQLGSNPIELTKKDYIDNVLPDIHNFIITEKIDGIRAMLIIYPGRGECHIIDKTYSYMEIPIDSTNNLDSIQSNVIILDTEKYNDKFYVFDVLYYNDIDVSKLPFIERLNYVNNTVKVYDFLQSKHFMEIDNINKIQEFYDSFDSFPYPNDGLIFISKNHSYNETLNFKWKPVEKMTIDFVAKKCPDKLLGINPYIIKPGQTLYLLFSGIRKRDYNKLCVYKMKQYNQLFPNIYHSDAYLPIQFSPSDKPFAYLFWSDQDNIDNNVVELTLKNDIWKLVKIREDRTIDMNRKTYYGNYFKYAELIWMNYKNPLSMSNLCEEHKHYFKEDDNQTYKYLRKFNNFVKDQLITLYTHNIEVDWVIDLASGKGQDLFKYIDKDIKNILMVDVDKMALMEIINRKYIYINNASYKKSKLYIKHLDLNTPYKQNLELIKNSYFGIPYDGVPLIICNLALHYLIPNKKKMQNFIGLLNNLLDSGGIFIYTAFDGKKVFDLLKETPQWFSPDNKYSIKKLYTDTTFTGINQQISVLLPFSNGEYYTENLINTEIFADELSKKKISLNIEDSFDTYLDQFQKNKESFYNELNTSDKEFISLYSFHICHKAVKRFSKPR